MRFTDVRWVAETGSTNADVMALARDGAAEGTVVVADHQTAGRGRKGRTWTAPPGASLLMSILLRPPAAAAGLCTMAVGVSAAAAIEDVAGFAPGLKWPNDLVHQDHKLAGILAEADWRDGNVAVVVGIGINVNWPATLPDELAGIAASINHISGHDVDRKALLDALLRHLETVYGDLVAAGPASLVAEARRRSATLGRRVRVDLGSSELEGVADALLDDGRLEIETLEGERRAIAVGDVVHLRLSR